MKVNVSHGGLSATYNTDGSGNLILTATDELREILKQDQPTEVESLEPLIANSTLECIDPSETGDLTDAPMLGIKSSAGEVLVRWAFMDYQIRSFVDELIETGKAVFVS